MHSFVKSEDYNDKERYKIIKRAVDDFIGELNINIPGLGNKLLTTWHEEVFKNGSKKDATIVLTKKDIMWSIIVIATDIAYCDDRFLEHFDTALYDEIVYRYKEVIDSCCEKFEFFIKVLHDYNSFSSSKQSESLFSIFLR